MRFRVSQGWAVSVLLASVGCGQTQGVSDTGGGAARSAAEIDDEPVAMALDFAQSGSRLVALGYSSNEAKLFRTFHDSQLGFDCAFLADAGSDHQRCAPSVSATVVYTDAACTELAGWSQRSGGDDWRAGDAVSGVPNVVSSVAETCPGDAPPHREAYRLGPQLSEEVIGAPAFPLFQLRDSRCQPASTPAKVTPPVYRLVPLAESELARGERVSLDVGEGLRLTRLVADDGAALNLGVTGADRTPCELQRDGECVPEPIARPSTALDGKFWTALTADCTQPAFVPEYSRACGTAKFGVEDDGVLPPKVHSLAQTTALFGWQVVQPIVDSVTYACSAYPIDGLPQGVAPALDLTGTLPTASRLRRGSGPLHVDWYSVGQSELFPVLSDPQHAWAGQVPSGQFVNDAGQPCLIWPADDGTVRCVVVDDHDRPIADVTTFPKVIDGPL